MRVSLMRGRQTVVWTRVRARRSVGERAGACSRASRPGRQADPMRAALSQKRPDGGVLLLTDRQIVKAVWVVVRRVVDVADGQSTAALKCGLRACAADRQIRAVLNAGC
eukprot:819951-Rhodomonas_salina.2